MQKDCWESVASIQYYGATVLLSQSVAEVTRLTRMAYMRQRGTCARYYGSTAVFNYRMRVVRRIVCTNHAFMRYSRCIIERLTIGGLPRELPPAKILLETVGHAESV